MLRVRPAVVNSYRPRRHPPARLKVQESAAACYSSSSNNWRQLSMQGDKVAHATIFGARKTFIAGSFSTPRLHSQYLEVCLDFPLSKPSLRRCFRSLPQVLVHVQGFCRKGIHPQYHSCVSATPQGCTVAFQLRSSTCEWGCFLHTETVGLNLAPIELLGSKLQVLFLYINPTANFATAVRRLSQVNAAQKYGQPWMRNKCRQNDRWSTQPKNEEH